MARMHGGERRPGRSGRLLLLRTKRCEVGDGVHAPAVLRVVLPLAVVDGVPERELTLAVLLVLLPLTLVRGARRPRVLRKGYAREPRGSCAYLT